MEEIVEDSKLLRFSKKRSKSEGERGNPTEKRILQNKTRSKEIEAL